MVHVKISLQRGKTGTYDIKQSDGQAPIMLGLWRMQNTPLLLLLPGPLWPLVVALERVLCVKQN